MKLILENWREYLNEAPQLLDPPLVDDPREIKTIGQLHDYFMSKEPGKLKKLAVKVDHQACVLGRTLALD